MRQQPRLPALVRILYLVPVDHNDPDPADPADAVLGPARAPGLHPGLDILVPVCLALPLCHPLAAGELVRAGGVSGGRWRDV